jgi:hypothetical protein
VPAQPTGHASGAPEAPGEACPNCGELGLVAYCSRCGEKRRDRSDYRLASIAGEAFSEIANLEHSKLWRSLRLLLLKPGQLTRDHWDGIRVRYLGPLKLYFIFFALSLLLYSIHQGTAVYDVRRLTAADASGRLAESVAERAAKKGMSAPQFAEAVNARWRSYLSASQVVYPLFVALALKLLYLRRRLHFAEHLIFAFHVLAFVFLSACVVWPFYLFAGSDPSSAQFAPSHLLLTGGSLIWTALYLVFALRRAYAAPWLSAFAKAAVVFLTYFITSILFMAATLTLALSLTSAAE